MDDFDRAQEVEMLQREVSLANALRAQLVLAPRGECLFCEEPLPYPHRFCDADCTRGWEREQEARKRNGVRQVFEDPMDDWSASG